MIDWIIENIPNLSLFGFMILTSILYGVSYQIRLRYYEQDREMSGFIAKIFFLCNITYHLLMLIMLITLWKIK